jgi:diaminohydroxyphosphoribosylaminopyrimidine deaminase/5-amino-6-(5-phosphoribosylamino)uracil reductase
MKLTDTDTLWMSRAIQLAERGRYTARPNPCVGCLLVKDHSVIGEGWHYRAGEAHAEVHAIGAASVSISGATAYVTLEPCHHQGQTGPCTQTLIDAGVSRVVYGMQDPNPLVAGQGLAALAAAGIDVDGPVLESEARALNPGFISRMERQRPWLRCKLASSLDGRSAMASGESQWITGPAARADGQLWRARSAAIITGIDSVLLDNSRLTLRKAELALDNSEDVIAQPPLRVVLDSTLRISLDAAILQGEAPSLVICTEETKIHNRHQFQRLASDFGESVSVVALAGDEAGRVPLAEVLSLLANTYHSNEVLLEAGATLSGAFFQQGLIDELIIYQAPVLLGSAARPMLALPLETMADKFSLDLLDKRQLGQDQRIIARPKMNKVKD